MADNNLDFLNVPAATEGNGSEYTPLEEGCYEAHLAAIVGKKLPKYQSEELEEKIIFTFQIVEEDQTHYVSTNPMKRVLNDKSNLYSLLHDWTKKSLDELEGFNMGQLIGAPCQLTIKQEKKGDKTYLRIGGILSPKKSQKVGCVADEAPAFITKGSFFSKLADGITIKSDAPKAAPATAPAEDDDELPY